MRNALIAAGAMVAGLIVVIAVTVSGVIPLSTSGQPEANGPTRAQNTLNKATTAMANAPGASYEGVLNAGDQSLAVKDLQVTSAGDVHGMVSANGKPAEVLELGGATYVKADQGFWDAHKAGGDRAIKHDTTEAVGHWALVPPDFFGVDLGSALRPSAYGLGAGQPDERIGQSGNDAKPLPAAGQTPDRRGEPTTDPKGLVVGPAGDDGQTIVAGDSPIQVNGDGAIVGIGGPLPGTPADRPVTTKLKVSLLTNDGVRSFYSTVEGFKDPLSKVPAPQVQVARPAGKLNCQPTFCILPYHFSNTMPGADRGTVTVRQFSELTVNDAPGGDCQRTITMPMNGTGESTCTFQFAKPDAQVIHYNATSTFDISAVAEKDVTVIVQSAEKGRDIATRQPGHWYPGGFKTNPAARQYNRQITGVPSGFGYLVGDFPFDGRANDGTLLMTGAPGYGAHVLPNGTFDPAWPGTAQIVDQARKAKDAAKDQPLRWVFAEPKAAGAMAKLLAANHISGIQVVTVPEAR